jgi:hypothetical protein
MCQKKLDGTKSTGQTGLGSYEKKWLRPMIEEMLILTEEFTVDLGSCLRWGKLIVGCF